MSKFFSAPPIAAPSPEFLAAVTKPIEDGLVVDGPIAGFDPKTNVFFWAVVSDGLIVHWQIEACLPHQVRRRREDFMAQAELVNSLTDAQVREKALDLAKAINESTGAPTGAPRH